MFTRLLVVVPFAAAATGALFLLMRELTILPFQSSSEGADLAIPSGPRVHEGGLVTSGRAANSVEIAPPPTDRPAIPIIQRRPFPQCGSGRSGKVVLDFAVGTNRAVNDVKVISATSPCFAKAAKLTVLNWRYRPKIEGGQPVHTRLRETLYLYLPPAPPRQNIPQEPPYGPAAPLVRLPPDYPVCGQAHGEVTIEFFVEADGQIRHVTVVSATSDCFALAAINAAKEWRYRPRIQNGARVRSNRQRVTLAFYPD